MLFFSVIEPYYRPPFQILRPIISLFLRGLLIFFGIFQTYYRVLFRLFGPITSVILLLENITSVILIFFFLGKRGSMRFLARIVLYDLLFF